MDTRTTSLLIIVGAGAALIGAGIGWLARLTTAQGDGASAQRILAWLSITSGFALVVLLAGLQLTGRLGPGQLWFRAPSFYLEAAILLAGVIWWFRREIDNRNARLIRLGLPALALGVLATVAVLLRLTGHSTPLSTLLPTMRATAPALSYFDTTGHLRQLADLRGKVVLVNFWATWCAPCRLEMPLLSKTQVQFGDLGLVVVYLSLEEPGVVESFLQTHHFAGVMGRVAHAADYYRAGRIYPLSYLIGRDGRVAKRWSGRPAENWLQESIRDEL